MHYEFPLVRNISEVLPAIEGRDEIVVAERDGYTIINYTVAFEDTFPAIDYEVGNPADWHCAMVRRECRGMVFDNATGEILRRPYHKFFNVNEREETQDHRVNLGHSHAILEKLDGSMIAPFLNNGEIIWGTRMCAPDFHEAVSKFVEKNPHYELFARETIGKGFTPIFEWCSRKKRIVLDYGSEDQLVLTAIRNIYTGVYTDHQWLQGWEKHYNIPVVRAFEPQKDMKEFLAYVHDLEDVEGFVVRFGTGHMVKLKCHWYVQIHKAKEKILQDRNIVELILEGKLDDVKAHLPTEDRDRLSYFESQINSRILDRAAHLSDAAKREQSMGDRKFFALNRAQEYNSYSKSIVFALWDDNSYERSLELVRRTIRNNLGRTVKYEAIRDVWFPGLCFN